MIALRSSEVTPSLISVNRIQRQIQEILRLTREIRDRIEACHLRQIFDTKICFSKQQNVPHQSLCQPGKSRQSCHPYQD